MHDAIRVYCNLTRSCASQDIHLTNQATGQVSLEPHQDLTIWDIHLTNQGTMEAPLQSHHEQ